MNLIDYLLNSDRMEQGSNEAIWTLIAIDAGKETPDSSHVWNRSNLLTEILEYQCEDGSFSLSKNGTTGSVDMTAMALQSLANYQTREDVSKAIEKGLSYLQNRMDECDYGTVESNAQVIVALLMLGINPVNSENGFTEGSHTLFTALDKYRAVDGGFKHTTTSTASEAMSTQQALLAVASWERYMNGENNIYDIVSGEVEVPDSTPNNPQEPDTTPDNTPNNPDTTPGKELIGHVTIAVEKFSIGQGYLVEPEIVPIYKDTTSRNFVESLLKIGGENPTAAKVLTDVLDKYELSYEHKGTIEDGFYLSAIVDTNGSKVANFSSLITDYATKNGITLKTERKSSKLGEFDYSSQSGWKYTVNDEMVGEGLSQMELKDGDVVRVRFTSIGYGGDLGNNDPYVENFMPITNGDELTKLIAQINSADNKEELLSAKNVKAAYDGAITVITNLESTQEMIDVATASLKQAVDSPMTDDAVDEEVANVMDFINQIGTTITLESKTAIEKARTAYDKLSEEQKQQVVNYFVLENAENTYNKLKEEHESNLKIAQVVIDKIASIGTVTSNSEKTIKEAREAYNALTEEQKKYVYNLDVLEQAEQEYAKINEQYLNDAKEEAKAQLDSYKDSSKYNKEQQEELKAIIEEGKLAIDNATTMEEVTKAKEDAMKKMDEVKTSEELIMEEEGKEPITLTDSNYFIAVTGEHLTENMSLQVRKLGQEDEAVDVMRKEINSSKALINPYEIMILENNQKVDVEGPFTVFYYLDSKYNDKTVEVFLLDENNKLTKIEGTVKNNLLKVQVERLGSFAVVVDSSYLTDESLNGDGQGQSNGNGSGTNSSTGNSQGGNSQGGNAQTGDDTQIMLYISLLGISMVSVLLATKKYKKVNN